MAVKSPSRSQDAAVLKQVRQLGRAIGEAEESVRLVTFDPEYDILAVFVDAAEDKSRHEKAAIHVWNEWADRLARPVDFRLFNLDNAGGERAGSICSRSTKAQSSLTAAEA